MQTAVDVLRQLSLAAFLVLGLVSVRAWRREGSAPAAWAAGAFGLLSAIALIGQVVPEDQSGAGWDVAIRFILAAILVFPYLVYRFATSFEPRSTLLDRIAIGLSVAVVVWTFLAPRFPEADEPRPAWLLAFTAVVVVQWTFLFLAAAIRLFRAGRDQPTVARRRMRLLALGAAGMNVLIVISAFAPSEDPTVFTVIVQTLSLASAAGFGLGLAPPKILRTFWRQAEQRAMLEAISDLLASSTEREVTDTILPNAAAIVGAEAAVLTDRDGETIAAFPSTHPDIRSERGLIRIPMRYGELLVTAGPYTPFFGAEEIGLLRSFGALADLALERTTLFDRERSFIANAAHELRTPLAVLSGLTATMRTRWGDMDPAQIEEVLEALDRQGSRAATLVNQLLDIAYIEHAAIEPEPVPVSTAVKRALEAAPAPEGTTVTSSVADDLVARAEPDRLEQILINLLTNAYRYGGTTVTVEAAETGGTISLSVADDGEGVPPALIDSLFEPFTRARSAKGIGSGLGLAIARRLAEAFNGSLTYENGEGARFVIRLRAA